jgi:hypothetical protein
MRTWIAKDNALLDPHAPHVVVSLSLVIQRKCAMIIPTPPDHHFNKHRQRKNTNKNIKQVTPIEQNILLLSL